MKNKLLLVLSIIVGLLVIGVILKKNTGTKLNMFDQKKHSQAWIDSTTNAINIKVENEMKGIRKEVKTDSINYWRIENSLFPTIYRFDKDTGTIFTTVRDAKWNERKVQYRFDYKKTGDLIMLNYVWGLSTKTEYWTIFNENTLVNTVENQKLKRINH